MTVPLASAKIFQWQLQRDLEPEEGKGYKKGVLYSYWVTRYMVPRYHWVTGPFILF